MRPADDGGPVVVGPTDDGGLVVVGPVTRVDGAAEVMAAFGGADSRLAGLLGKFDPPLPEGVPWLVVLHEAAHAALLGLAPPWNSVEIDRRLSAMRPHRRVTEEVRAGVAGASAGASLGLPVPDPAAAGAGTGAVALLNERLHGGSVETLPPLSAAIMAEVMAGGGPLAEQAGAIMPLTRRMAARALRSPRVTAAALAVAAAAGVGP